MPDSAAETPDRARRPERPARVPRPLQRRDEAGPPGPPVCRPVPGPLGLPLRRHGVPLQPPRRLPRPRGPGRRPGRGRRDAAWRACPAPRRWRPGSSPRSTPGPAGPASAWPTPAGATLSRPITVTATGRGREHGVRYDLDSGTAIIRSTRRRTGRPGHSGRGSPPARRPAPRPPGPGRARTAGPARDRGRRGHRPQPAGPDLRPRSGRRPMAGPPTTSRPSGSRSGGPTTPRAGSRPGDS